MKRIFLVLFFSFVLFGIILSSVGVLANYGSDNKGENSGKSDNSGSGSSGKSESSDSGISDNKGSDDSGSSGTSADVKTKTDGKSNSGTGNQRVEGEIKKEVKAEIRSEMKDKLREEKIRIKESFDKIKTEIEIEQKDEENRTKVEIKLSDGRKKEIKIMPGRASDIAQAILQDRNYSLILKEIKEKNNNSKAVYYIVSNETGRFLGIFKTKVRVETEIDSETGNITKYKKKWWSVFVFGEDKKVVICHIPRGNPENEHTIVVGAPAVRAHLAHGDRIGACSSAPVNDTNITTPDNNTNITIPPQNDTNVTVPPQDDTNSSVGNNTNLTGGPGVGSAEINVSVNVSV